MAIEPFSSINLDENTKKNLMYGGALTAAVVGVAGASYLYNYGPPIVKDTVHHVADRGYEGYEYLRDGITNGIKYGIDYTWNSMSGNGRGNGSERRSGRGRHGPDNSVDDKPGGLKRTDRVRRTSRGGVREEKTVQNRLGEKGGIEEPVTGSSSSTPVRAEEEVKRRTGAHVTFEPAAEKPSVPSVATAEVPVRGTTTVLGKTRPTIGTGDGGARERTVTGVFVPVTGEGDYGLGSEKVEGPTITSLNSASDTRGVKPQVLQAPGLTSVIESTATQKAAAPLQPVSNPSVLAPQPLGYGNTSSLGVGGNGALFEPPVPVNGTNVAEPLFGIKPRDMTHVTRKLVPGSTDEKTADTGSREGVTRIPAKSTGTYAVDSGGKELPELPVGEVSGDNRTPSRLIIPKDIHGDSNDTTRTLAGGSKAVMQDELDTREVTFGISRDERRAGLGTNYTNHSSSGSFTDNDGEHGREETTTAYRRLGTLGGDNDASSSSDSVYNGNRKYQGSLPEWEKRDQKPKHRGLDFIRKVDWKGMGKSAAKSLGLDSIMSSRRTEPNRRSPYGDRHNV